MTSSDSSNIIASLDMTCGACPAQWEGRMQDGRCIYVRFRHGRLSIGFGETPAAAVEGSLSRENVYEEDGNRGDMELVEMLERTGLKLAEGIEVDEDRWWLEDH